MIENIWFDGRARRVETIKGTPGQPLVVILPSYTTTIDRMKALVAPEKFGDWNICIPEALPRLLPRWNDSPYPKVATGVDDVGFIEEMIKRALTLTKANAQRVFLIGFSNGSFMINRLYHEAVSLRIRAAVCVSGALPTGFTGPNQLTGVGSWTCRPHSMLMINGTEDDNAHYDGEPYVMTVPQTALYWKDHLVPNGTYTNSTLLDATADGTTVTAEKWVGEEGEVQLMTIVGGGHYWPGSTKNVVTGTGKVCMDFDATLVARDWFALR